MSKELICQYLNLVMQLNDKLLLEDLYEKAFELIGISDVDLNYGDGGAVGTLTYPGGIVVWSYTEDGYVFE